MYRQEVVPMGPKERIRMILLIEKIRKNTEFAKKITVEDSSHFKEETEK